MLDGDPHDAVGALLQGAAQRYTASRRALVDVLRNAGRPLTIPDVLAADAGVPQSSVYRNLAVLEQAGAVRKVLGADGLSRYELAEHLTGHHHHLVCLSCGSVADVTAPAALERTVERATARAIEGTGFRPQGHRLDVVGLCRTCA